MRAQCFARERGNRSSKQAPKTFKVRIWCTLVLSLGCPFIAAAAITDANWSAMGFASYSVGQSVFAVAVGNDYIYAGGTVTNSIARWNGSAWTSVGSGLNGGNEPRVYALATVGNDLYAGGAFTNAGGVSVSGIAKWDGSTWSALGGGVNGTVLSIAEFQSNLYVGGSFTTAGGTNASNIAKWDGNSWSPLDVGFNGSVLALAVVGNNLYAGGQFTTSGSHLMDHIAKWDGNSWSSLGGGGGGVDDYVYSLAVSGTNLYVGGSFTHAFTNGPVVAANYIAKWNGSQWSALGTGLNNLVSALAVTGSNVFASGYFMSAGGNPVNRIAKWDGSGWSALGSGTTGGGVFPYALANSGNDLYVGGGFTTAGGKASVYVARAFTAPLPALSVLRSGNQLTVSWPSPNTDGFVVEQTSSAIGGNWVSNSASVNDDGTNRWVSVPATNNGGFFRLRKP